MFSKNERIKLKLVGKKKLINKKTGEVIEIDFEETPVFTKEECDKLHIGEPNMKSFSEMTEEDLRIFSEDDI